MVGFCVIKAISILKNGCKLYENALQLDCINSQPNTHTERPILIKILNTKLTKYNQSILYINTG